MGPGQKCKVSAHNLHKYELRTATSGTYWASKRLRGFRLGTEEQLDPNDSVGTTSHQSLSAPPADPDGVEARDAALGKDQQPIPTMVAEFDGGVVPIPSEAGSAGIKHPQGPEARTRTGNTRSRGSFCVSDEVEAILKARLQFPAIERGGAMEMGGSPLWPGEDDLNDVGLDREHIELLRCVRRYEEEERNGDESESEAGQSEGSPFSETADLLLDENHHLSAGKSNEEAREDRFKGSCELRRVARAAEDMLRRGPPRFSSENEPSPKHEPTALPTARGRPRSEKNNAEVADVALVNLQQQCESNVQGASDTFSAEAQGENAVLSLGFDYESTRRTDRAPGNGKGLYSQQSSAVDHETVEQRNVAAGKQPQNDHRVTLADVERTVNSAMVRACSPLPSNASSLTPCALA